MIHQADLLFLPHDSVGRKCYTYALVVGDITTRYKDAEPLTSKKSSVVAKAFEKIYSRKLNWPEVLMTDPGKEFLGSAKTLIKNTRLSSNAVRQVITGHNLLLRERIELYPKDYFHINTIKK